MHRITKDITIHREAEVAVIGRARDSHGGLGNMAGGYPLEIAGIPVISSESYYQAMRFPHRPDIQEQVLAESNGFLAKKMAHRHVAETRKDWDDVKVSIMAFALQAKAAWNRGRIEGLLGEVGSRQIVERSALDDFWGAIPHPGGLLVGRNVLGKLWMELRDRFLHEGRIVPIQSPDPMIPDHWLLGRPVQGLDLRNDVEPVQAERRDSDRQMRLDF